jgi:hypothetical protein
MQVGNWSLRPVLTTFENHYDSEIVAIRVDGEWIESTSGHPYWVEDGCDLASRPASTHEVDNETGAGILGQWVDAYYLQPGDRLRTKSGKIATIAETRRRPGNELVYNLEVEGAHTFAVGHSAALVHNNGEECKVTTVAAAKVGDTIKGVDPLSLKPGRRDLVQSKIDSLKKAPDPINANPNDPIKVTKDGKIYDGHHRVRIAAESGKPVDVVVVNGTIGGPGGTILDLPIR